MSTAARYLTQLAMDANDAVLLSHGFGKTDYLDYRRESDYWRLHSNGTFLIVNPSHRTGRSEETAECFQANDIYVDTGDGYTFVRHENSGRIRVFRNENRLPWNA